MKIQKILVLCILSFFSLSLYASQTYYLITHGSQDPYWNSIFAGANEAAKNLNVKLKILAPVGGNDVPKQVQLFESALATTPAGIATTLPSESAFSRILQRASANKIPVIAFDAKPKNHLQNPYLAYLGSDNLLLGEAAANEGLNRGLIKATTLILNPQPGHIGLELRAKGIKNILQKNNIKVVELDVGTEPNQVKKRVTAYLIKNKDTQTIVCLTSQALDPIGSLFLKEKSDIKIITFDNTPNTQKLAQLGIVHLVMDQQPYLMGYLSITQLVLWNRHHLKPVDVATFSDIKN